MSTWAHDDQYKTLKTQRAIRMRVCEQCNVFTFSCHWGVQISFTRVIFFQPVTSYKFLVMFANCLGFNVKCESGPIAQRIEVN